MKKTTRRQILKVATLGYLGGKVLDKVTGKLVDATWDRLTTRRPRHYVLKVEPMHIGVTFNDVVLTHRRADGTIVS